jgi:hypothetical protein
MNEETEIERRALPFTVSELDASPRRLLETEKSPNFRRLEVQAYDGSLRIVVYYMLADVVQCALVSPSQAEWIGAWIAQGLLSGAVCRKPILDVEEPIDLLIAPSGTVLFVGDKEVSLGAQPRPEEWFRAAALARKVENKP